MSRTRQTENSLVILDADISNLRDRIKVLENDMYIKRVDVRTGEDVTVPLKTVLGMLFDRLGLALEAAGLRIVDIQLEAKEKR